MNKSKTALEPNYIKAMRFIKPPVLPNTTFYV